MASYDEIDVLLLKLGATFHSRCKFIFLGFFLSVLRGRYKYCSEILTFHRAFFNSLNDKHQPMHFAFNNILV